jgi:hypothetical protein
MKTNKQLIKKLSSDAIEQGFLICAVEWYCKQVIEDKSNWGDKSVINQDLWKVVADHNLNTIKEHFA